MNGGMLGISRMGDQPVQNAGLDMSSNVMQNDWNVEDVFNDSLSFKDLTDVFEGSQDIELSQWNALNSLLIESDTTTVPAVKQESVSPTFSSLTEELIKEPTPEFDPNILMSPLALNYDSKSSSEDLYSMSSQSPEMVFEEQPKGQTTNQLSMDDNENGILQMHYQKFVPIKPKVENQDDTGNKQAKSYSDIPKKDDLTTLTQNLPNMNEDQTHQVGKDFQQKVMKRQQRIIRNRESALHSRKRKKEMMQTLEVTVNTLSSLNSQLKIENDSLKETIRRLEMENWQLKSKKLINIPDVAKKTSYILVVFVFLAINLKQTSVPSSSPLNSADLYKVPSRHGRLLLEFDKQKEAAEKNFIFRNTVYDKVARPVRPKTGVASLADKNLIKKMAKERRRFLRGKKEESLKKNGTAVDDCPSSFNETELFRLNEALGELVKMRKGTQRNVRKEKLNQQVKKLFAVGDSMKKPLNCSNGKNNTETANCTTNNLNKHSIKKNLRKRQEMRSRKKKVTQNEIQIFQRDWSGLNMLQKAIDRKPDTFYVMSFRKDQIIFPATQVNNTQRPRLSFIFPLANQSNWNKTSERLTMVQIDCQVMDTKTLQISKDNPILRHIDPVLFN